MIFRVDDRLLHGQVIYGWGVFGPVREVWLINDAVEANPTEKEVYTQVLEGKVNGGVLSFKQLEEYFHKTNSINENSMLVVENCEDLKKLVHVGIIPQQIHLGAISKNDSRKVINGSVALNEDECEILRDLRNSGYDVIIKDLPDSQEHTIGF